MTSTITPFMQHLLDYGPLIVTFLVILFISILVSSMSALVCVYIFDRWIEPYLRGVKR